MLKKIFVSSFLALSLGAALPLAASSHCPCPNCECSNCDCDKGEHCDHCD